jgi:hypothetical protein
MRLDGVKAANIFTVAYVCNTSIDYWTVRTNKIACTFNFFFILQHLEIFDRRATLCSLLLRNGPIH